MVRRRTERAMSPRHSLDARAARFWIAALLVMHAALALWAMAKNSVTFDENFHLPAGLMIVERGDYFGSVAQPPLPKVLYALPAALLGAHLPDARAMASGDEGTVGESFMRMNWQQYAQLFFASRLMALLFSLALALLIWRWARALHGEAAGVLAVALYALSPEALAHAGIVGTDLPTALAFTLAFYTLWRFLAATSWRTWALMALAISAAFLSRFSAVQLVPVFLLVTLLAHARSRLASPRQAWLGLLGLAPVAWLAVAMGYRFEMLTGPWNQVPFRSSPFLGLLHRCPWFSVPLPTAYVSGLDYMMMLNDQASTYLLGHSQAGALWYYFPLALLFKLPLGTWGTLIARAAARPKETNGPSVPAGWVIGLAATVLLVMALFFTRYNFGIRYLLPLLPLACVWCGGLLDAQVRPWLQRTAVALTLLLALESSLSAPWFLSFYNWPAGGSATWRPIGERLQRGLGTGADRPA